MKGLHLFNPQNDLALALNLENYTAPPAAVELARAGSCLPLWYGKPGDEFVTEGVNARWLGELRDAFGMEVRPWGHSTEGLRPEPWGWSKAARRDFLRLGFGPETMPDDAELERLRELSGRRSACILGRALAREGLMAEETAAMEIRSLDEAREYAGLHPDALLKLPWSSSGRGQIRVSGENDFETRRQAIEGALRRYGYLTAEPFRRDKLADVAHLFEAREGRVRYCGLSVFETEPNGDYSGNVLGSEEALRAMLESRFTGIAAKLDRIAEGQAHALESLLGNAYEGPLGVDMMIVGDEGEACSVVPCVELNLRMTMGHVAHRLHEHYCGEETCGRFYLQGNARGVAGDMRVEEGKVRSGVLRLNPAEYAMGFFAEVGGDFQFV